MRRLESQLFKANRPDLTCSISFRFVLLVRSPGPKRLTSYLQEACPSNSDGPAKGIESYNEGGHPDSSTRGFVGFPLHLVEVAKPRDSSVTRQLGKADSQWAGLLPLASKERAHGFLQTPVSRPSFATCHVWGK